MIIDIGSRFYVKMKVKERKLLFFKYCLIKELFISKDDANLLVRR